MGKDNRIATSMIVTWAGALLVSATLATAQVETPETPATTPPTAVATPPTVEAPAPVAPRPTSSSVLDAARDDVRISRITHDRVRKQLDDLLQSGQVDPGVLADYALYLDKVRSMTRMHEQVVREMESVSVDAPPPASTDDWPTIAPESFDPGVPVSDDPIARLDRELAESLSEFDQYLLDEQAEALRRMQQLDEASSEEMTELAREAAAAVERLREKGVDIDTSSPPPDGQEGQQGQEGQEGQEGQQGQQGGQQGEQGGQQGQQGQQGGQQGQQGEQGGQQGQQGEQGSQSGGGSAGGSGSGGGASGQPGDQSGGQQGGSSGGGGQGDPGQGGTSTTGGDGTSEEPGGDGSGGAPGEGPGDQAGGSQGGDGGTAGEGTAGSGGGEGDGTTGGGASGTGDSSGSGSGSGGSGTGETPAGGGTPGSGGGEDEDTPAGSGDRPPADDDDIVARQLREAAERETDPELREKLWEEYDRYKGNT